MYGKKLIMEIIHTILCFRTEDGCMVQTQGFSRPVSIERKADLAELSQCFCQSRQRFEREFERALKNHADMYLLVEDATWENIINGKYATHYNPKAYFASITAWQARYGIKTIFCKSETSGKIIKEILYRELKERLEQGFMTRR